jgi:hypothetical protein
VSTRLYNVLQGLVGQFVKFPCIFFGQQSGETGDGSQGLLQIVRGYEGKLLQFLILSFKLTGSKAGVLTLRHSAITHFLSKPNLTTRQKEDMAKAMGHSVSMQGLYNRVDIDAVKEMKDDA